MKSIKTIFFLFIVVSISSTTFAGSYKKEYIAELVKQKVLPEYCQYMGFSSGAGSEKGRLMRKTYGTDWAGTHHYCWALVDFKKGFDKQAIGNLNYVLNNSSKSFKLRPMILLKKATILSINKQYYESAKTYNEVIEISPDSELAYVGLSHIFKSQGDFESARMLLQKGLRHIPSSRILKEKLESFR